MKRFIAILVACVGALTAAAADHPTDRWPALSGDIRHGACIDALRIARAVFNSESFYVFVRPPSVPELTSVVALQPQATDISGGNALDFDDTVFDQLPVDGLGGSQIFWEKKPPSRIRIVVREQSFNWQGDIFFLYAVDARMAPTEFKSRIIKNATDPRLEPLLAYAWRPPLVLRDARSGRLSIIDVGHPAAFLHEWRVLVAGANAVSHRCIVRFRPNVKQATTLLPPAVRSLARLLDQTLGSGENEGTLNPTARIRIAAAHTWANAALRPWALQMPYNTREEVDAGLLAWSRKGPAYARHYEAIINGYAHAEQALTDHYHRKLKLQRGDAQSLATRVLDGAFRSHFVFSKAPD